MILPVKEASSLAETENSWETMLCIVCVILSIRLCVIAIVPRTEFQTSPSQISSWQGCHIHLSLLVSKPASLRSVLIVCDNCKHSAKLDSVSHLSSRHNAILIPCFLQCFCSGFRHLVNINAALNRPNGKTVKT